MTERITDDNGALVGQKIDPRDFYMTTPITDAGGSTEYAKLIRAALSPATGQGGEA